MLSTPRILYLGIDPPPKVFHYPVIKTEPIDSPELQQALTLPITHIIFTSKNAVRYWPKELKGIVPIAIGEGTAGMLHSVKPLVAPDATQEGVIHLLERMDLANTFLLYPRSKLARPPLAEYLKDRGVAHFTFDLYDTVCQRPEPVPDLADFDEIVFTSPSTVKGFFQIYDSVPRRIVLTSIGPVTKKALAEYF